MDSEKLQKLPKWAQEEIVDLERDLAAARKQLASLGAVPRDEVEKETSYLDDYVGTEVIPFDFKKYRVRVRLGRKRHQQIDFIINDDEKGAPRIRVYAGCRMAVHPISSSSMDIEPRE